MPLRALLDERLGLPLRLDNPLRASTVAELWFGAGREVDDLVVLTLRAGVGAGIAIGGQLYRGFTQQRGRMGPHLPRDRRAALHLRQPGLRGGVRQHPGHRPDLARAGTRRRAGDRHRRRGHGSPPWRARRTTGIRRRSRSSTAPGATWARRRRTWSTCSTPGSSSSATRSSTCSASAC
ncbi:ROK family protein [Streptomyces lateritius]|nr:ROK family protein [Streptomyces lateritius]